MFEKIVKELEKLNPNLGFTLVSHPIGGTYVDVRGGKSVSLKALLRLPEGWKFKEGSDHMITNGDEWSLHLVPIL